jgi:hypothetical protein
MKTSGADKEVVVNTEVAGRKAKSKGQGKTKSNVLRTTFPSNSGVVVYVEVAGHKTRSKLQGREKSRRQQSDMTLCTSCGIAYGDPQDPKSTEEWLKCKSCNSWFHLSCTENTGIIEDDEKLIFYKYI